MNNLEKEEVQKKSIIKNFFKKFWYLLWKDDSLKGWVFSIIFLFIFIKFIFFPGLSFITGTQLPLAIVESCSMYHQGNLVSNFNLWFERHEEKYLNINLTKEQLQSFIFKNGFNKGDILFIIGVNPEKIKVGDVIIFEGGQANPIIHRVVKIEEDVNGKKVFSTMGDNNNGQLSAEKNIPEDKVIGKAVFKLAPYLGWFKLIFVEYKQPPENKGMCNEN